MNQLHEVTTAQTNAIADVRSSVPELAAVPLPGRGATWTRWAHLITVARADLARARLTEGHLDSIAILHELNRTDLVQGHLWGVWAAEPERLAAEPTASGWILRGVKQWCSGSLCLDRALVTALAPDGARLFVVEPVRATFDADSWRPLGMQATATFTAHFDVEVQSVAAVGCPGSYTDRAGFGHGGAGVGACWLGGALGLFDALATIDHTSSNRVVALGEIQVQLEAAIAHLQAVAARYDAAPHDALLANRWAASVRLAVEQVARRTLDHAIRSAGADRLCHQPDWQTRIADLAVYLSQLDADRTALAVARDPRGWPL